MSAVEMMNNGTMSNVPVRDFVRVACVLARRSGSRQGTGARCVAGFVALCALLAPAAYVVRAAAAPPAMQAYADPDKRFVIAYPQGWKVKRSPGGTTDFYLDDPDEGTTFTVLPAASLKGEMDAAHAFAGIVEDNRKRYPDLRVAGQRQRVAQGTLHGTTVEATLTWTGARRVPMKAWASLGAIKMVGQGRTVITFISYQAPAAEFDRLVPLFSRMLQSLNIGPRK
ncbi:MAG: hypothetical protein HY660_09680 [Armatimonadetes bacterium]|nr:hypothetical protein [Armatimonadota bacterium]